MRYTGQVWTKGKDAKLLLECGHKHLSKGTAQDCASKLRKRYGRQVEDRRKITAKVREGA